MAKTEPPDRDDRSAIAKAIHTATEVTTVAFMMVVPILPGYWLDQWLSTFPLFMLLGLILGMTGGIWQLIKMVQPKAADSDSTSKPTSRASVDDDERRQQG